MEKYKTSNLMRSYIDGVLKNIKITLSEIHVRFEGVKNNVCLSAIVNSVGIETVDLKSVNG